MDDWDATSLRTAVGKWLEEAWDPDLALAEWRDRLADSGWGAPTWPRDLYGRDVPAALAGVVDEEFSRVGAVGAAVGSGMALAAPTLLAHGAPELQRRLLRRILTGEEKWCQLFSEPGNGSDLAGLTTRAERDGDEWVVNGQKVWTTGARSAARAMLLARTDWDVPKHKGITYFVLPMDQPGVEVRPIRQMNGYASFNEVFITDARLPASDVVGEIGEGWRVALTTLAHERGLGVRALVGGGAGGSGGPGGPPGRAASEAAAEAAEYAKTYVWYPQRAGRPDLVAANLREAGRGADPVLRQQAVDVEIRERVARWNVARARVARARGQQPGPEGSLAKLTGSDIARRAAAVHASAAGAGALVSGPDSPLEGLVAEIITSVPAGSIAGGTDEVQHNILGERALGLPREPAVDTQVPFREVRTNLRPDRGPGA
ncbi:MAG TPA: acyl-CoA dehydrogenase family protein [Acidimicrobiales bacterium]|nr:acyl-CoA dehydrogenase family protein [Acidimicrobiales bacterium]